MEIGGRRTYFGLLVLFIEAYRQEMAQLFNSVTKRRLKDIEAGKFLQQIMEVARKHKVTLDGNFSTLMVGTIVLEGIGRQLDPDINFMEMSRPFLFHSLRKELTEKFKGKLMDYAKYYF
jgi:predicted unusual protein kinase regulating ubiquinone biosynthesis (AarF/ABC1/UbiB family)